MAVADGPQGLPREHSHPPHSVGAALQWRWVRRQHETGSSCAGGAGLAWPPARTCHRRARKPARRVGRRRRCRRLRAPLRCLGRWAAAGVPVGAGHPVRWRPEPGPGASWRAPACPAPGCPDRPNRLYTTRGSAGRRGRVPPAQVRRAQSRRTAAGPAQVVCGLRQQCGAVVASSCGWKGQAARAALPRHVCKGAKHGANTPAPNTNRSGELTSTCKHIHMQDMPSSPAA